MTEPNVGYLVLHPPLLIAAGFECVTTRDVRFLNAYRKHFTRNASKDNSPLLITADDFKLGGIMNPFDLFLVPSIAYYKCKSQWCSFPYLTYQQIFQFVYEEELTFLYHRLLNEVLADIRDWAGDKNIDDLRKKLLRPKESGSIYNKIVALHMSGLGEKLRDAFYYCIDRYREMTPASESTFP